MFLFHLYRFIKALSRYPLHTIKESVHLLTLQKEPNLNSERDFYRSIDVYVNVEPCIQCCAALIEVGPPRRIFFGCANERFGGCGSVLNVPELLGFHNTVPDSEETRSERCVMISGGHRSDEAIELLKTFYKGENMNAPIDKRKPARD